MIEKKKIYSQNHRYINFYIISKNKLIFGTKLQQIQILIRRIQQSLTFI